ncbi:MAG TPA: hypothetical protein VH207_13540 [Chthoniobacterales bacterium]|jgi:hypothetical protein|nr:hypothetical protein [Chthoniobacterales bacterium]
MKTPETLRALSKESRKSRAFADGGGRDQINISRSAFAGLLNSLFYPNPDDSGNPGGPFGPYGPGGPVSRLLWAALNPQPLPPGPGDPYSELAWVALNPQPLPPGPDPYRSAFAARAVITRAAAQAEITDLLESKHSENGIAMISERVSDVVDDWCGTPVPGRHGPGPHFVSLLAAGAQFQSAADNMQKGELQSVFSAAATKLFKTALAKLEN